MQLLHVIPALPVSNVAQRLPFYCSTLGFTLVHQDRGFAIVQRDAIEIHLWEADDESWRNRREAKPVLSGAESFLAGTASCRIAVTGVDELHHELEPHGIIHPNAPITNQPWGTREFGVLDPDNNLITFFERQ